MTRATVRRMKSSHILVHEASVHRNEGKEKADAILLAARAPFVPIATTGPATVIVLIPAGPPGAPLSLRARREDRRLQAQGALY